VLYELTQADTACVWAERYLELRSHHENRDDFGDPPYTSGIELQDIDCRGLKQLFEYDSVRDMFACRHLDRMYGSMNRGVAASPRMSSGLLGSSIQ
jgi:hypothetical protein